MSRSSSDGLLADLDLSRRLEWTEARSNAEFAEARAVIAPETGAEWIEVAGATAIFDGSDSPCTQTFGLGMRAPLTEQDLERIEAFYRRHNSRVFHEVSPLADITVHKMLSQRGYYPVEMTNVLFASTSESPILANDRTTGSRRDDSCEVQVRTVGETEFSEWAKLSAAGWSDNPEFTDLIYDLALVAASRERSLSFIAEIEGRPVGTAGLILIDDVALLTGASTLQEYRRRGVQRSLLRSRLEVAFEMGCQLAMICALPGSSSQRNAERSGFRIAYTRIKWALAYSQG
ncbi:MAG: GNAT family N-acetyltransferase [Acidobacteria bacterium]|nr:GNAT family N-acetyltransferase [Acidobacteriota bacterium]